tara:strand:+ start:1172 stop:1534 length:363 start_codon:yes stop_codon:yes gene_type:complete
MSKYIIEDWIMYDRKLIGITSTDPATGLEFADIQEEAHSIRVFGTKAQLKTLSIEYSIDESYSYEKLEYGSYWEGICFNDDPQSQKPTLKEYNDQWQKTYKYYLKIYKQKKNKPIKIKLI